MGQRQDVPAMIDVDDTPAMIEAHGAPAMIEAHGAPAMIEAHDTPATIQPLRDTIVIERFGAQSSNLGRVAVGFAGLLAAEFGATVIRIADASEDAARRWKPLTADGESALYRFLTAGKRTEDETFASPPGALLLTDDDDTFANWPTNAKVIVRPAFGIGSERPQSELTIMAASGLLDIMGEPGRPPLPLAGHSIAYAAGIAAFDALLASLLASRLQGAAQPGEVSCLDVATWLNWKLCLDSVNGPREAGMNRREEWTIQPCRDGFVAAIFLDNDIPQLATLTRSERLRHPDFSTGPRRRDHLEELLSIVSAALVDRTRDDIIAEAERLRLPFAPVLSPREVIDDPQMVHRRFFRHEGGVARPAAPVVWNGIRQRSEVDVEPAAEAA
jgi:crotonobetainyl-CoA:carnitine CoA-transferase CaiB-like acyl-CoA transferase